MYLQVAIDRVSVSQAASMIAATGGNAEIIEVGTSLIKDFGLENSVGVLKKLFPGQRLLADVKTIDEGAYEFQKTYEAGADIATVMGASSLATIGACRDVAAKFGKEYMIDLLEVSGEKLRELTVFDDAIFCLHLPSDLAGAGLQEMIESNMQGLRGVKRIAVAGGVNEESLPFISKAGAEIVIVGGVITKSKDIAAAVRSFKSKLKGE